MFSWSKKKESKRRGRPERESEENEFGIKLDKGPDDKQLEAELKRLTGVDSLPEDDLNLNDGEEDVESELLKLIGGGKGKRPPKKPTSPDEPIGDISDLTADIDLGDEDVEVDENDPDLLGELLELINPEEEVCEEEESEPESEEKVSNGADDVVTTLKERLKLYKTAEAKAKENNESSRARRFSRGIKTLEDLLKKAKAGKPVSPDDIPPPIATNLKPAPPPPAQTDVTEDGVVPPDEGAEDTNQFNSEESSRPNAGPQDIMATLTERLKLYQTAEAKAKESGETTRARRFNRGIKTLQGLIKQAQAGNAVAPGDIPPEVALNLKPTPPVPPQEESSDDAYEERVEKHMGTVSLGGSSEDQEPEESQAEERNILDVLSERLKMYKTAEAKAKESGETSRARRFGRGIKTLQELIKQASAGKLIAADDIPPEIALNLKPAPPVAVISEEEPREAAVERIDLVRSSDGPKKPLSFAAVDDDDVDLDGELGEEDEEEEEEEAVPTTVLEGLEQRVRLYTRFKEKAKEEGNSALADQNDRIVRMYLNAIKTFKSGGFVDVEKLPNPMRCPPIPIPFFIP